MAKKNELPALIASLLITVALLGGGAWWLANNFLGTGGGGGPTTSKGSSNASRIPYQGDNDVAGADGRAGVSILPGNISETKQKGLDALAAGDYAIAQTEFRAALQADRNDPESVIYLNNAEIESGNSYSIAVSVPTGKYLGPALEILRGVAQAQRDINAAGGINGTPLKVLLFNDEGSGEVAQGIASALVEEKDVLGVVGHYSSDTTLAAGEVYEAGKLPAISPTSTAVKISSAGDYIFRTVPSDRLAAAALARYVLNTLNKKQAAVFYTGKSAYSQSVKSEFTTELLSSGGEVVADFDIDDPGFSSGSAVQEAKAAGADVIMLALTEETEARSLQILSVNQGNLPVVGGDSLYDFNILDSGREDAVGLTVAVPWHILSHSQSPFVKESQQLWGASVNWRTVTAYDAVQALAAAIASGGASREGVLAGLLSGESAEGATNPVRFFPDGDRNQPSALVKVEKKPNGPSGTGYDYIPVP